MRIALPLLALAALLAGGCSIYKAEVRQGNPFVFENAAGLSVGDDMERVRELLGPPHVVSRYRPNRWHYFHRSRRGKETLAEQSLVLEFGEDRQLVGITATPPQADDAQ